MTCLISFWMMLHGTVNTLDLDKEDLKNAKLALKVFTRAKTEIEKINQK